MPGGRRPIVPVLVGLLIVVGCGGTTPTPSPSPSPSPAEHAPSRPPGATSIAPAPSMGIPALADVPFYRGDVFGRLLGPGPGPTGRPDLAWQAAFRTSNVWPLLIDGLLVAGRADGPAVALDGRTGEERWRFGPDAGVTQSIAAADGSSSSTDRRRCTRSMSRPVPSCGRRRSTLPSGAPSTAAWCTSPRWAGPSGSPSGPASEFGSGRARRVARAPTSASRTASPSSRPATAGSISIDVATGAQGWPPVQSTSLNPGSVEIVSDTLYAGAVQGDLLEPVGQLYAIDRLSGRVRWRFPPPSGYQISAGPVQDGIIYVTGPSDGLFALRDDGDHATTLWHVDAPSRTWFPVLVGSTLFVQRFDGSIGAYDTSGNLVWETAALDSQARGPLVSGGMVFTENDDNGVMAFADPSLIAMLPRPSPSTPPSPAPRCRPPPTRSRSSRPCRWPTQGSPSRSAFPSGRTTWSMSSTRSRPSR